ncbi:hypothetical protein HBH56_110020 [Parastagonospora nodorum]|uniref:Uncharacterized protein n=1 Tax=Phaeosphaeria nodorum (strain SN15 / ATCC MYA-4574 / FGSC 10173) TaxID=321614 RepID=A0A7U2FHS8_PHANO|nr:hypothetical protein HBH56_110020 [Parastagonospora nodorum]QRD03310.1 hypothetical protein JI435_441840 [Parastagonospora nodorum SN15]KAH3925440.1 hypothetical protein HBH54_180320 [Parastagonospora nodorum]KAH4138474.1 hypothetical protein HBH45_105360 [Parastagonospora nodorum]KAH4163284.1 hypothetical protein HBH44_080740 [Parastagonospora nodorum]
MGRVSHQQSAVYEVPAEYRFVHIQLRLFMLLIRPGVDDFSTRLANNTTLALNGILALSTLSSTAQTLYLPTNASLYSTTSTSRTPPGPPTPSTPWHTHNPHIPPPHLLYTSMQHPPRAPPQFFHHTKRTVHTAAVGLLPHGVAAVWRSAGQQTGVGGERLGNVCGGV